jgi:cytochrome c5
MSRTANAAIAAIVGALALAAGGAGCGRQLPPLATSADAQRANVELASLQEGRTLVLRKCGGCHRPPLPRAHPAAEWPGKIDEMAERSNLDLAQRRTIEQYLIVMADAPPPAPAEATRSAVK